MRHAVERHRIFEERTILSKSLDHIPAGEVWSREEIEMRKESLLFEGLEWSVVDNLVIHDDVKLGALQAKDYVESYKETLLNLSDAGIKTVYYNFNPVFYRLSTHQQFFLSGKHFFRIFDPIAFAVFDIYILKRDLATDCYNAYQKHAAKLFERRLSYLEKKQLEINIMECIQNRNLRAPEKLLELIDSYSLLDNNTFKRNFSFFQHAVLPFAEAIGLNLKLKKDDSYPTPMGLPTIHEPNVFELI